MRKSLMKANYIKMKLNQEDEIEYSLRINSLNTGGSCSGVRKKYLYIIKMIFGVYVVGKS